MSTTEPPRHPSVPSSALAPPRPHPPPTERLAECVPPSPASPSPAEALLPEERRPGSPVAPRRLLCTFRAAFRGLGHLLRHEPNAQIHAALALAAVLMGLWLGLTPPEWAVLMALFGLVIGLEALNTAIEGLADLTIPHRDPRVGTIKDVAAGGVLAAAMAAAAAGAFLFVPRLLRLFD